MTTMRTIRQDELGGPEVLHVVEVPVPEPAPTEVLVRVAAAGVNPVDWKTRASGGRMGDPPFTVGWDVAGTVEALGEGVTGFEVGDRVFGMPAFPDEAAAYAEFVTARSRHVTKIPDTLADVEAGALPLASLTAYQALVDTAGIGGGGCSSRPRRAASGTSRSRSRSRAARTSSGRRARSTTRSCCASAPTSSSTTPRPTLPARSARSTSSSISSAATSAARRCRSSATAACS
jgi:hypothetical protein